jgi:hypothetical protein
MDVHVHTAEEVARAAGREVVAHGRYEAAPRPRKGTAPNLSPFDRAVLRLDDGARLWLEPLEAPASVRPAGERERLDGRAVRARGVAHRVMPASGASVLDPCLADVHVEADE